MKSWKGLIQTPPLIAIIAGVLVLGSIYLYQNYQSQKAKEIDIAKQDQEKKNSEEQARNAEIEKLKNEVESLKNKKPQVIVKEVPKSGPDLPTIISQWRPKVAHIECQWYTTSDQLLIDGFGSGYLIKVAGNMVSDSKYWIVTNQHVVAYANSYAPAVCYVKFPGTNEVYTQNDKKKIFATSDPNVDIGFIVIDNPSNYLQSIVEQSSNNYCAQTANVGDQIVVLGYPSIGSPTDITATEGIISGYENNYYITSAKVDHGNSGGLAISLKNNCYLGIPTYVAAGELESLARVFDFQNFLRSSGEN
jgi:S1-C subfamily serine protease